MAQPSAPSSYDDLPYPSNPFPRTHPDHLASIATLFDLSPVPADECRLLELGCASGGNLIPMAVAFPGSRFVGVDYSETQIEQGRKTVAALGLKNIELRHASILDVDESYGPFDYVICHGVYSWVPEEVQEGILRVLRDRLTEHGVGYVSYNTFPGWHMRGMIRDMMCYHVSRHRDLPPLGRVAQARGLLNFLARSVQNEQSAYSLLLKHELETLQKHSDSYLFHEHLEEVNQPLYFHQFMERASAHGLQYVWEARPHSPMQLLSTQTRETLDRIATDLIDLEQNLDFLHNRTFRRTLLCHQGQALHRDPHPELARAFRYSSFAQFTEPDPDISGNGVIVFRGEVFKGTTNMPLVKLALADLMRAFPERLSFEDLFDRVWPSLKETRQASLGPAEARTLLGGALFSSYQSTLVRLHVAPQPFTLQISERPKASPLARWQAATTAGPVASLCHQGVPVDGPAQELLSLLDGTQTVAMLEERMAGTVPADDLRRGWVAAQLENLARMALLVA